MSSKIKQTILLIDDDQDLLENAQLLLREEYNVLLSNSVSSGKATVRSNKIDIAVVDLNFEGHEIDGLNFIDWVSKEHSDIPVIVLSGDQSTERVVGATRRNLVDFIPKSHDYERDLRIAINKGLELRNQKLNHESAFEFQTKSPKVKKVLDVVDRIARSGSACAILITGETGSGKEVLAKHYAAKVKKQLVAANMASIPKETAESELFGHVKGAFTGAYMDKPGLVTQAHNGIFFLDELGECSLSLQAKLLRVVQEREIQPVGSVKSRKVEVQFLAATNRNLMNMVEEGQFRLDLLQRVNTVNLHLPPLRDRPEDIEFYTTLFLDEFSGSNPFSIRASGLDVLLSHSWPGNVRELENVIQKISILSSRRELDGDTVCEALNLDESSSTIAKYNNLRTEILSALEKSDGNRTYAAEALGMHITTLFRWIKKLGIGHTIAPKSGRPKLRIEGIST